MDGIGARSIRNIGLLFSFSYCFSVLICLLDEVVQLLTTVRSHTCEVLLSYLNASQQLARGGLIMEHVPYTREERKRGGSSRNDFIRQTRLKLFRFVLTHICSSVVNLLTTCF